MKGKVEVDVLKSTNNRLSFEAYSILYLKYTNDTDLLAFMVDGNEAALRYLEKEGWIHITNDDTRSFELRQKAVELFTPETTVEKVEDVESWYQDFRDIFKSTRKPGAMGDPNATKDKLKRFVKKNPKYTKEQILNAARNYCRSCATNSYRFLQEADYFIYKMDTTSRVERSRLLVFLEQATPNKDNEVVPTLFPEDKDYTQVV